MEFGALQADSWRLIFSFPEVPQDCWAANVRRSVCFTPLSAWNQTERLDDGEDIVFIVACSYLTSVCVCVWSHHICCFHGCFHWSSPRCPPPLEPSSLSWVGRCLRRSRVCLKLLLFSVVLVHFCSEGEWHSYASCFTPWRFAEFIQSSALLRVQSNLDLFLLVNPFSPLSAGNLQNKVQPLELLRRSAARRGESLSVEVLKGIYNLEFVVRTNEECVLSN